LNSNGDLSIVRQFELIKSNNIVKDTKLQIGNIPVSYMELITSTMNFILILQNGTILNYSISYRDDELMFYYEDRSHVEFFNRNEDLNYYTRSLNGFEVNSFKQTKFSLDI